MTVTEANRYYLDSYRRLLQDHSHEIVAVVAEPRVQGAAGFICQPDGFLEGLAQLCKEFDVLLIADEIAVGMGRTGKMFALEHTPSGCDPVEPDLMCIGKGLTGGYLPMSATLASSRIWEAFLGSHAESKTFYHGHTYGGNPLAAAAAHAVLDLFATRFPLAMIRQRAETFSQLLVSLREIPYVGDVRQMGMMAAVELVEDPTTRKPFSWDQRIAHDVCCRLLRRGIWLRPLGNVIPIIPPLSISEKELACLIDGLRAELLAIRMT
jgi:adenosylmethionine-8-amino-7-oxononanoate aminotransferase